MSSSYSSQQDSSFEYQDFDLKYSRSEEDSKLVASRRPRYSRRGKTPAVHNGIHRRRNKRWSW